MAVPVIYGAAYSVYVRAARLAAEEKQVAYRLEEVDIFAADGPSAGHAECHPFNRIPAFEHDGFRLYETGAITRYIEEAFDGPALMPGDPRRRARVNQVIGILDAYAYKALVWDIYVERMVAPREGRRTVEERIAAAIPVAETCLAALHDIGVDGGGDPWFVGESVTLADLHAAPMFAYFLAAPEAQRLIAATPGLVRWWEAMRERPSMAATRPEDALA